MKETIQKIHETLELGLKQQSEANELLEKSRVMHDNLNQRVGIIKAREQDLDSREKKVEEIENIVSFKKIADETMQKAQALMASLRHEQERWEQARAEQSVAIAKEKDEIEKLKKVVMDNKERLDKEFFKIEEERKLYKGKVVQEIIDNIKK